jgi:hypothetical protein
MMFKNSYQVPKVFLADSSLNSLILLAKLFASVILLSYAAIQDIKYRELNVFTCILLLFLGVVSTIIEACNTTISPSTILFQLSTSFITLLLLYFMSFYKLGDMLILFSISLIHPSLTQPVVQGHMLSLTAPVFGLTVLLNTELFSMTVLMLNLIHNLRSEAWNTAKSSLPAAKRIFYMFFLRAVEREEASSRVYKPFTRRTVAVSKPSSSLKELSITGNNEPVFVQYVTPMAFFILVGYLTALLFGSLVPIFYAA